MGGIEEPRECEGFWGLHKHECTWKAKLYLSCCWYLCWIAIGTFYVVWSGQCSYKDTSPSQPSLHCDYCIRQSNLGRLQCRRSPEQIQSKKAESEPVQHTKLNTEPEMADDRSERKYLARLRLQPSARQECTWRMGYGIRSLSRPV